MLEGDRAGKGSRAQAVLVLCGEAGCESDGEGGDGGSHVGPVGGGGVRGAFCVRWESRRALRKRAMF